MTPEVPTYAELEKSLREAEEILDTLRNHKADAVIGTGQVALMRLKEVEDRLQERIRISGDRLREIESIYQNVPVGLCILDRDLKFVRVNNYLAEMNGIPAEEHKGRTISELLPGLNGDIEQDLRRVIETGEPKMNVELRGETPARPGVQRCWLEHWLPVYNRQEQIIGINMVIEEITGRKQYEDKLRELNIILEKRVAERTKVAEQRAEKLHEMALQMIQIEEKERQRMARVLHDGLQQLLIGAKFNASLIEKRLSGQKNEVSREVKKLNEILDQSIESSRSLSYELSPPILHDQGLLAALHWLAGMRHMEGLAITIHQEGEIPELSQNLKVFFFQSIRELLVNIIKHANADEAEVRVSGDGGNVIVEVIDRGKGFDPVAMENNANVSQGLRNIREKLDLMNGRMEIESKPGRGSRFMLRVPVGRGLAAAASAEPVLEDSGKAYDSTLGPGRSTPGSSGGIRVLVVDDHQVMRNGLVSLLKEEPDIHIIGESSSGVEAVEFVHNVQPDVIIMDITMPEMDGIEATRLIHEKFPGIRIIGLSMHEESEYDTQIKQAGATDLLNKAGPAEQLLATIRNVCRE